MSASLFHSLAYSTYVTLPRVREQTQLEGFGRLGIYSQPMECGRLEVLPSPGKPLARPLSSAAVTAAIRIKIRRQGWPFRATAAAVALAILPREFLGINPTLSPPRAPAGHGPIQGTPVAPCCRPSSSVLPIASSRTRAHTSPWSLASSPALPSRLRSAASGAWEGAALEGSRCI